LIRSARGILREPRDRPAFERHDQIGQRVGIRPFPRLKFGRIMRGQVDVGILSGKAEQEPALALAAILALPQLADQLSGRS
jgi:hypothetical protein